MPATAGMSKGRSDGEVKHNQQRSHKNMEISHAKKNDKIPDQTVLAVWVLQLLLVDEPTPIPLAHGVDTIP